MKKMKITIFYIVLLGSVISLFSQENIPHDNFKYYQVKPFDFFEMWKKQFSNQDSRIRRCLGAKS